MQLSEAPIVLITAIYLIIFGVFPFNKFISQHIILGCDARSLGSLPLDLPISSSYSPPRPSSTSVLTDSRDIDLTYHDHDLHTQCIFQSNGHTYNLCPLLNLSLDEISELVHDNERSESLQRWGFVFMNSRIKESGETLWSRLKRLKEILSDIGFSSTSDSCPEGARICLIEWDGPRKPATSLFMVLQGEPFKIYVTPMNEDKVSSKGQLRHRFKLKMMSGERSEIVILVCDLDSGTNTKEDTDFISSSDSSPPIILSTRYACPIENSRFRIRNTEEEQEPSGEEGKHNSGEGDLVKDIPVGGIRRGWLGLIALSVGCTIILTAVFVSSPQARGWALSHLQYTGYTIFQLFVHLKQTPNLRKHFQYFGIGERRAVRWAQEDMSLEDSDIMVNSRTTRTGDQWNELDDEYIPLKASPHSHSSTYGSVPLEEFELDESSVYIPNRGNGNVRSWVWAKLTRSRSVVWK